MHVCKERMRILCVFRHEMYFPSLEKGCWRRMARLTTRVSLSLNFPSLPQWDRYGNEELAPWYSSAWPWPTTADGRLDLPLLHPPVFFPAPVLRHLHSSLKSLVFAVERFALRNLAHTNFHNEVSYPSPSGSSSQREVANVKSSDSFRTVDSG